MVSLLEWDENYIQFSQLNEFKNFNVYMKGNIKYQDNYVDTDNFLKCTVKPIKRNSFDFSVKIDNIDKIHMDTFSDNLILPLSTTNKNYINNKIKEKFEKMFDFIERGGNTGSNNIDNIIVMMESYKKPKYMLNRPNTIDTSKFNIVRLSCIDNDYVKLKYNKSLDNPNYPIDINIKAFKNNLVHSYSAPINYQILHQHIFSRKNINRKIYLTCEIEYVKLKKTVYVYHNIYLKQIDLFINKN